MLWILFHDSLCSYFVCFACRLLSLQAYKAIFTLFIVYSSCIPEVNVV